MKIQLRTTCISKVPLKNYVDSFIFKVNGEEFRTSYLIADLLSPKISEIHLNDPTYATIIINTNNKGDFTNILNLINFDENDFQTNELPFVQEIIEILGNESIKIYDPTETVKITKDNVFALIKHHEKYQNLYNKRLEEEIEFVSKEFGELIEIKEEEFENLDINTLYQIVNHPKLLIKTEDQLLNFINNLYSIDSKYSILYESVCYKNITSSMMISFFSIFDLNDITSLIWQKLSYRFQQDINFDKRINKKRYKERGLLFTKKENEELSGILDYLYKKTNGEIEKEIKFISSSVNSNSSCHQPQNIANHEEQNKNFCSENSSSSWICIDFNKYKIVPTDYEIRSRNGTTNWYHPKSWIIECSNDNIQWEILDEQIDCPSLNGKRITCSFKLKNHIKNEYRYFRMRNIGQDWYGANYLTIEAFEIYGKLV